MKQALALLSVSDKSGVVDLAQALISAGYALLSTGGTASALRVAGVPVRDVSEHTGHPEIMHGRVKTLHPRVHGGILGLRQAHAAEAAAHDIDWIDVVAVNLYPFEATIARPNVAFEDAIEQIDIGGPSMIRSAAKNHRHVSVLTDPADYAAFIEELPRGISAATRLGLARKAFAHTARYDAVISAWLTDQDPEAPAFPDELSLPLRKAQDLRYGENPHQKAAFYSDGSARSLARARQLQGKELSFNNIADLDATVRAAFDPALRGAPTCVIVKHNNPCGAATHPDSPAAAYKLALSADPVSAYGGVLAFNRPLDAEDVRVIRASKVFFEVIAAPGLSEEAASLLRARENLRVLDLPADWADLPQRGLDMRRVTGGLLVSDWDLGDPAGTEWRCASDRDADGDELAALRFAWVLCGHVKSNAIVLARAEDGGLVLNGVGAGQMSRVDSVGLAIKKATRPVAGSVLASDAFFPFPDGVQLALEAGVRALVQPGGSIRDGEVLDIVNASGTAMLFTKTRHFRH